MLPVGVLGRRSTRDRRWCRWRVPGTRSVCGRRRMGRNAWCSVLVGALRRRQLHGKRGSGDRVRVRCFLSVCGPGGAPGTIGGVAGAFPGVGVPGSGAGWVGTHGVPCWLAALALHRPSRNVGAAIGLVLGAFCRRMGPEEGLRPPVVSLVRSWDSECLWAAPDGTEHMVFRVARGSPPFSAPR
jgi:hypothetical protein